MSHEVIAAIIAAVFSLASVVLSVSTWFSLDRRTRREERRVFMDRYRGPLIHAAYNLQSRLHTILTKPDFLDVLCSGDNTSRERRYYIDNTAYVVAQYFAWAEIIRREIFQLDLGEVEGNRSLSALLDAMYGHWQDDRYGKTLRVFAGEQRAIGEAMLTGSGSAGERQVLGYGEFLKRVDALPFINDFRTELGHRDAVLGAIERLRVVQHALVDLTSLLDPGVVYVPASNLKKA